LQAACASVVYAVSDRVTTAADALAPAREGQKGRIDMTTRRPSLVHLSFVAASFAVLSGCEPGPSGSTVTIHYSQVGACNGYQTGSGITSKRPKQAFVVFKIESFDTSKSGVPFSFVPVRLFVNLEPNKETWGSSLGAGKYYVSGDRRFTDPLGAEAIKPVRAPARATTEVGRLAFIGVPTAEENGAAEANRTSYHLSYDPETGKEGGGGPADPHIEFVKTNDTQSTWPATDDCLHLEVGP
jgi:hypothetical protein